MAKSKLKEEGEDREEAEKTGGLELVSIGSLYSGGAWDKKYWSSTRVRSLVFFFNFNLVKSINALIPSRHLLIFVLNSNLYSELLMVISIRLCKYWIIRLMVLNLEIDPIRLVWI